MLIIDKMQKTIYKVVNKVELHTSVVTSSLFDLCQCLSKVPRCLKANDISNDFRTS